MKTSTAGIELIKKYEGCVLTAYKFPSGILNYENKITYK